MIFQLVRIDHGKFGMMVMCMVCRLFMMMNQAVRICAAFLVGGCIAVGVGFVVKLLSVLTGGALL